MIEPAWNRLHLERPPNARWHTDVQRFDTAAFRVVLEKIVTELGSQETLAMEAAILSRLIYRMKSKFRNDKGLKNMSKVNRALLNYLSLSLEKEYKNLTHYIEPEVGRVALPSRQMLEYVLVRTQGLAKLLSRLEETARCSGHFFKTRMSSGHAWSIAIVAYSVISRIWILSRYLTKKCCDWYNGVYKYLKFFKRVGVNWLPQDQVLPTDLRTWLALPWINDPVPSVPSSVQLRDQMFKLITPRAQESDEESLPEVKQEAEQPERAQALPQPPAKQIPFIQKRERNESVVPLDDAGEVVSRGAFELRTARKEEVSRPEDARGERLGVSGSRYVEPDLKNEPAEKPGSRKVLTFDNVRDKSELAIVLNRDTYPGLDKLRWSMVSKKAKKLLKQLDTSSDKKAQSALLKKTIKRIQQWTS